MLNAYAYSSALFAISFIVLGLLVFLRNSRQAVNRLFFYFSVSASGWILSNYFGGSFAVAHLPALIANHLVLGFACGMALFLVAFVVKFINLRIPYFPIFVYSNVIVIALCASNLIVKDVSRQNKTYSIHFGQLSFLYFLILSLDFFIFIAVMVKSYIASKGELRAQLGTILLSFFISLGAVGITNGILPATLGYYGLTNLGSLMSAFLVLGLAYTIVRHKLFDIRLVVARSLAYVSVVAILGVAYSLLSVTVISHVGQYHGHVLSLALNTLLIILAAASFSPLKVFFDKITNRFFYQDAYDSQLFLDQFNKILVSTYDLSELLKGSNKIIAETLKLQYSLLVIKENGGTSLRTSGTTGHPIFNKEIGAIVHKMTNRMNTKLIVADLLGHEHDSLKEIMRKNGFAVIAQLSVSTKDQSIGYLLLGPKMSGGSFTTKDLNVIEIVSNELVIAIQNSLRFEEIKIFNRTLQEKIEQATRKIRHSNEKLKALDETKDDFISMASHQLRTPLTSVKGYISLVLEGDAGKLAPLQQQMLEQAFMSSQRMVYLIADLLNVSRLKTGKFIIESKPVNLATLINEEISQLTESIKSHQLTLKYNPPKDFPELPLDETKIRQVVMNFADNAIYYTQSGGHVEIELLDTPSTIEFRVVDNGLGVPKNEQPHLFTKFYRAANARKARPDGTGLGLFMAKKVIAAQGGALIFESVEGKGSTFGFSFNKQQLITHQHNAVVK